MTMVVDDHGVTGPGRRRSSDLTSTAQAMTRSEYERSIRNVVPPEPCRGTEGPPPAPGRDVMTLDEFFALVGRSSEIVGAVRQLQAAGFEESSVVMLMLGADPDAPDHGRVSTADRLLDLLRERGGEYVSMDGRCVSELAHLVCAEVSTLTKALTALAKAGKVIRTVSHAGTTRVALP